MNLKETLEAKQLVKELLRHMDSPLWEALATPDFALVTRSNPEAVMKTRCEMITNKLKRLEQLLGESPS